MACRVGKLTQKNTAIFLCDLQEKFRDKIQYFSSIVEAASRLLKLAKILNMPVVVTEQYPKGIIIIIKVFCNRMRTHLSCLFITIFTKKGLGHTVSELGLQNYQDIKPIEKTQFSMLTSSVVDYLTAKPDIKSVVLAGIETHVCVQGTCLSLLQQGLDVHVVVDGCSSRSMVDRMFAFDRMKSSGAWLTTTESVILSIIKDAAHPKFKEVQKLILEPTPDSGLLSLLSQKI